MSRKLPQILMAATLTAIFAAPLANAQSSVAAAYRQQLSNRVLRTSGIASARIAGALLGRYTRLDPNKAPLFAALARAYLRRSLGTQGAAATSLFLIRGLSINIFLGLGRYDPQNPKFVSALRVLIATIPPNQRTPAVRARIAALLLQINSGYGGSDADAQFLVRIVEESGGPPPVS